MNRLAVRPRGSLPISAAWAVGDIVVVGLSVFMAAWLRYDLVIATAFRPPIVRLAIIAALAYGVVALVFGTYRTAYPRGSFEETAQLARSFVVLTLVLLAAVFVTPWVAAPRSLPFVAPITALMGMFAIRFVVRSFRWGRGARRGADDIPVVVYGAGEGGKQLLRSLAGSPSDRGRMIPVALLDDDPRRRKVRLEGVRVEGGIESLAEVVSTQEVRTLIVAIPSLPPERLRAVNAKATALGLEVLVLPSVQEILSGGAQRPFELRHINLEDLLGRRRTELDATAIANAISGKRILVTGAGGSIGSELARQIAKFGPSKMILLDRDESALHATQMSLTGRAMLDDGTLALADIRDLAALKQIFLRESPEVVFHAAALKHLTLLELFPQEAWKSNVLGTLNVLEAAQAAGTDVVVNISTDKAASPTSNLGYSKRIAERLTSAFAELDDRVHVNVRFGNVLGSRGSVLTAFTAQIDRGGPVTVTHPDVERYFMLIPEACQLVLQAATMGGDGEVMVLDMGTPVKILDVAKTLIDLSGRRGVEIEFTGLRPGEKMSEILFSDMENTSPTAHPLVSHVRVPPVDAAEIRAVTITSDEEANAAMRRYGSLHD